MLLTSCSELCAQHSELFARCSEGIYHEFADFLRFPAASVNREGLIDLLLYYLIESTLHPNCMWAGGVWYSVDVISLCGTGRIMASVHTLIHSVELLWKYGEFCREGVLTISCHWFVPTQSTVLIQILNIEWLLGRSVSISTQYLPFLLCHSGYLADYQLLPDSSSFSWRD